MAVVVGSDSLLGQVARVIDDLTAHQPAEGTEPCLLCSTEHWPCSRFTAAAQDVMGAGLRLDDLVSSDLHQRLWPPQAGTEYSSTFNSTQSFGRRYD
ncbi:hypothetical protein [Actinokineospora sp.]|uniref:hypothetical protein n=1 Tax=Actinokineospora sp. TaxID=1872133 RepID=UPI003D6C1C22